MGLAAFNRVRREQAAKLTQEQEQKPIDQMTVAELKKLAKEKGIEGCDNMKKAELVAALTGGGSNDGSGSPSGNETQV